MTLPRPLIFCGPGMTSGSGFQNLVKGCRGAAATLHADIAGVVSTNKRGGVWKRAERLGIPFFHAETPCTNATYENLAARSGADFFLLSGWLQVVRGLDPAKTCNIHPGIFPHTRGLYGRSVHERAIALYKAGSLRETAVTMHFVTDEIDGEPVFSQIPVPIYPKDTPTTLGERVSAIEHEWQPRITDLVVNGHITWDGKDPHSLQYPAWYTPICRQQGYLDWPAPAYR